MIRAVHSSIGKTCAAHKLPTPFISSRITQTYDTGACVRLGMRPRVCALAIPALAYPPSPPHTRPRTPAPRPPPFGHVAAPDRAPVLPRAARLCCQVYFYFGFRHKGVKRPLDVFGEVEDNARSVAHSPLPPFDRRR